VVRDFSRTEPELENGLGSLIVSDIQAVETLQVKLAARVAKSKDKLAQRITQDNVKEESTGDEEVFTLGRMCTRSQTQVSQYFTSAEIEGETETETQAELWNHIDSDNNDNDDDEGSETGYDSSNDDDFDQEIDGGLDMADENIV
jgi:hypothetical protein